MYYPAQIYDEVVVISLKGKVTMGSGEMALRNTVHKYLNDGFRRLVLDMADTTSIDSTGIGELVSSYTTATNRGARLVLARLTAKIRDILTILQFIEVFDIYESVEEAVEALRS